MHLFNRCKNPNNNSTFKNIEKAQKSLIPRFSVVTRGYGKSGLALASLQTYHCYEIMKELVKQATDFISFDEVNENIKEAWKMTNESEDENE